MACSYHLRLSSVLSESPEKSSFVAVAGGTDSLKCPGSADAAKRSSSSESMAAEMSESCGVCEMWRLARENRAFNDVVSCPQI